MPKPLSRHWRFHEVARSAEEHHHLDLPAERGVWDVEVTHPALVLGSRQTADVVDVEACTQRGIEVCTRRSGGGLMLLVPGEHVWIDVVIPAGDPLWSNDVQASMSWLGGLWQRVLAEVGILDTTVATGSLAADDLGELVCFAGQGPGEVIARSTEGQIAKYVGISQRRTKHLARFQCTAYCAWDGRLLAELVRGDIDVARLDQMVGIVPVSPRILASHLFELISELD